MSPSSSSASGCLPAHDGQEAVGELPGFLDRSARGALEPDRFDHLAPALVRRRERQQLLCAVEAADPRRPAHRVTGDGEEITVELDNVYRQVGDALRRVDPHGHCERVRGFDDGPLVVHGAEAVRHVGQGDDPRALSQKAGRGNRE